MTLHVIFRNQEKYEFYGVTEYSIEDEKRLKFIYLGARTQYNYKNEIVKHEGCFMLDAIAGYYVHK
jgi:hypothetical protein